MSSEIEEIRKKKLAEMASRAGKGPNRYPDAPVVVTDEDFDEFVKKYGTVVVDCWAPWCGPCRMLTPTIEALAKDHKGKVVFAKLNTDDNFETSSKYGIMSIPTLLYFKDGEMVSKTIGALPRPMIEEQLRSIESR